MRYTYLLCCMLITANIAAQQRGQTKTDSLLTALERAGSDTSKVKILDKLSYAFSSTNPKEGLNYARQALQLSRKAGWAGGIASAYIDHGINHNALSNQDSALYYYKLAIKQYTQLKDTDGVAAANANIAMIYLQQGDHDMSLEYLFKSLSAYEGRDKKQQEGDILENIGIVYSRQGKNDKTLEYYRKAFEIYKQLDNKASMARNLGNRGIVDDAMGNYDQALQKHTEALKINEQEGNRYGAMINLSNIGYVYSHKQQYDSALAYQHLALQAGKQLETRSNIAVNLGNIGETYFYMAKENNGEKQALLGKAIKYLEEAIALCKAINFTGPLTEFIKYLSDAHYLAGNYQQAYKLYKEFETLQDSIFSEESKLKIATLETERELAVREKNLQLKNKEIQIRNLELEKKRNERLIFVISIALLMLAIAIIYKSMQNYRKSSIALSKERQQHMVQIEEQLKRIKVQTDILKEISHMQAHDIRGPVASILGLVQLFNFDDYTDPINKVVVEGISTSTQKLDAAVQEVIKRESESRGEAN